MAIDHNSKWAEARILRNKTATEVEKAIRELIIQNHGTPKRILTDVGLEFKNSIISKLCSEYNIIQEFASPNHHQTVGAVERVNQTIFDIIKKLSNYGHTSWENKLEPAVRATNMSFHRALRTFSLILKYGKLPLFDFQKQKKEKDRNISKREVQKYRRSLFP